MLIVATVSYPTQYSAEFGKRVMQMPPPPSFIKIKGPFATSELGTGIKGMSLFEFDQDKTGEAMKYVADRYAKYIGVPGLTYNIVVWFEAMEALKMIGLG
jgi:hypothetical protein